MINVLFRGDPGAMSKNLKINSLESEHRHVACSVQKYVCMSVYGMFYRGNISLYCQWPC